MLDIKFLRENPDAVKENIRKKFQESKLELVDQVLVLDQENRSCRQFRKNIKIKGIRYPYRRCRKKRRWYIKSMGFLPAGAVCSF